MPTYEYKGLTAKGKATRGVVDAESPRAARSKLRGDGIFPTEVVANLRLETAPSGSRTDRFTKHFRLSRRVPPMELSLATRQLATLIGAAVPLVESLTALAEQVERPRLKSLIARIRDRVNEGANFADALEETDAFPPIYVSLVRAGEAGGALEHVLDRLADYLESQVRLRNKVSSILIYPLVMLGVAVLVVTILVTVVLPQITSLLLSMNQELPLSTRIVIGLSDFVRESWWALALAGLAVVFAGRAYTRTERGRKHYHRLLLRAPVMGRIARLLAVSRFTSTLSTLLAGGVPIVKALTISKHVANNAVIEGAVDKACKAIIEGASLARPLRQSGVFPPVVIHMIEIGERSGELESMLAKVSQTFDEQIETAITRLTALLEPLLILVMVGVVLVIILATLVPLLQLTSSLG